MKPLRILSVGELKKSYWKKAADNYIKRIQRSARLEIKQIKDAPARLSSAEKIKNETDRLQKLVNKKDILICLDDKGKQYSSEGLARLISKLHDYGDTPCFVVGGAYGFSSEFKSASSHLMSLSLMTFPHELAMVILLEQIFRAQSIILGTGYHHG